jgi:SWI/SNF-related matrix-associated actin-dependent regulator 1 of chromatin subfamily A
MAERQEIQEDLRQHLPRKQGRNKKWSQARQEMGGRLDVILAPVTYFQKEKSEDRKFLNKFNFEYLVVDEAHMLKNSQSIRYKMLDKVKTRHRLLLTGTPVQNSPQELLNMLCFIMPLFSQGGGDAFLDEDNCNASVSERMLQHFVEHETMEGDGDEELAYKKLKQLFAPFVLRRKKSDVIAQLLPPKDRVVELVDLDPAARTIYENILAAHVNKNGGIASAAIGDHLFTNLRKAANHPLLLRTRHTSTAEIHHMTEYFHKFGAFRGEGSTKARIQEELSKFNDFHIHLTALELIDENPHRRQDLERYILPEDALFSSAKFSRLRSLLPTLIQDGHRILIFSVWTSCLDLLGCLVEHLGLNYLRMDGSCPSNVRQELIDRFNQDDSISIFLLSTKACGLGINLTAADTCIIHDLDFNPFNDLQAEDRCHRIGQKKQVTVYKMVTKNTVDADIYTMQERKSKMNDAIMESGKEKKERRELLQTAVKRFLGSPQGKVKDEKQDKENTDWQKEVVDIV